MCSSDLKFIDSQRAHGLICPAALGELLHHLLVIGLAALAQNCHRSFSECCRAVFNKGSSALHCPQTDCLQSMCKELQGTKPGHERANLESNAVDIAEFPRAAPSIFSLMTSM